MPKRKVLQTVILHRTTGRVTPSIGDIFDFTADEVETLNRLNPNALGRPVQEVDMENEAALEQARLAKEAEEKAAAPATKGNQAKGKDAKKEDDEV